MKTMVYKVRSIWLTVALTALIAVGAGYFARQHARAYQVQAPRLPATVVEIPAGAIEPADQIEHRFDNVAAVME